MSVNITNNYTGNIGRMFARQNVSSVYGAQKSSPAGELAAQDALVDRVTLSSFAPKPLTTGFLEEAMQAGKAMGSGQELPEETTARLREDRIFAAVSALTLIGYEANSGGMAHWPGGIPTPSAEEMEVARRRLSQRPSVSEQTADVATVQNERVELLSRIGKTDLMSAAGGQTLSASA